MWTSNLILYETNLKRCRLVNEPLPHLSYFRASFLCCLDFVLLKPVFKIHIHRKKGAISFSWPVHMLFLKSDQYMHLLKMSCCTKWVTQNGLQSQNDREDLRERSDVTGAQCKRALTVFSLCECGRQDKSDQIINSEHIISAMKYGSLSRNV